MAEIFFRAIETCVILAGALASIYAGKLWLQAHKNQSISEAKDEAIRVAQVNAEAWKSHYEASHLELKKYRAEVHAKNEVAQAEILKLTALAANTDLSPVIKFQAEQSIVNQKVLTALDLAIAHLKTLSGNRIKRRKPSAKR